MKVWKLFFIYTRGKGKNPFFHFSDFLDFPKILKKEYNIRFKIYPSPFTSSPQHISIIVFPTFVFLFTELSHVVQERARSFCPLPLLYPSASDFQFHSAGDRWFRACGAYMWNLSGFFGDIILSFGDIILSFGDIILSFGDIFVFFGDILLSFGVIFVLLISEIVIIRQVEQPIRYRPPQANLVTIRAKANRLTLFNKKNNWLWKNYIKFATV